MSTFGTAISPRQAEKWLAAFIERWIQEYLAWYERINAIDPKTFDMPWGIQSSSEFTHWQGENLPHIVIVSPGLAEPPEREGDQVNACWNMAITVIVGGQSRSDVRDNQMAYATAIWAMIEHNRSADRPNEIRGVNPVDIQFTDIPVEDSGSYGSATLVCTVDVEAVISTRGYPPEDDPRDDPYVPDEEEPEVLYPGKIIHAVERITP